MRLLFSDFATCGDDTLKRLLLLADEITFMDHPSVSFGSWGLTGGVSAARQIVLPNRSVRIKVYTPPNLQPGDKIYFPYLNTDIRNVRFRELLHNSLASSAASETLMRSYSNKFVLASLIADQSLSVPREKEILSSPPEKIESEDDRRLVFNHLLMRASIQITSTLLVAEQSGCIPVSADPHLARLLALRTCDKTYVGNAVSTAALIGLEVVKAVLPDELIARIQVDDILGYRETAQYAYKAWSTEIQRLATQIEISDPIELDANLAKIMASEVAPRLLEYTREMQSIRDHLFGNLVKQVVKWQVPALSLAYVASLSVSDAMALVLGALSPMVPPVIEYCVEKRDINRRNAFAFLLGLATNAEKDN